MTLIWRDSQAASRTAPLRVAMLGLRGFPDVQGGVERHVEQLSRQLVSLGCDVEAMMRSPYVRKDAPQTWHGVRRHTIWAPRMSGTEALVHSFLGVLRAARTRPDILHIHSIGPALFAPLARALGLRVVVTYHAPNYEHAKWGRFARGLLRLGERAGMTFAHGRIAVSAFLADRVRRHYRVPVSVIPNGIGTLPKPQSSSTVAGFGLTPGRYLLTVARLDPEKCLLELIAAFRRAAPANWKLAIAGGADYASDYARAVARAAQGTPGVVMLGHQTDATLAELYTHAGAFVLPSRHEGQPIVVIEALAYGCPLLLSDIPAHRELGLAAARFFPPEDIDGLAQCLEAACHGVPARDGTADRERILQRHDWRVIARRTLDVYRNALAARRSSNAPRERSA